MSFILDALKKSELERQRQSTPGLMEAGMARPRGGLPKWAIALGVLLAVNLLMLAFVLTRSWTAEHAAPAAALHRGTAARAVPAVPAAKPFSPLDEPVYAPEIPVSGAAPVTDTLPAAAAPAATPAPNLFKPAGAGIAGSRAVRRKDPLLAEDYQANEDEVLPTINEISLAGAQSLPELHLDVHVFATQATDRFVYVNMRKYHEGATLAEGPTVERIRRDGVILDYQGLRFLLPRQ